MDDTIKHMRGVCTAQRGDLANHLAAGGAQTYEEYCKAVGAIQALDMVLIELEDVAKKSVEG